MATALTTVFQINRLEGQVSRYKASADNSEKIEDELKAEKRKLQREVKTMQPQCWGEITGKQR